MLSLYSSWFNVESSGFSWRDTLRNWTMFLRNGGGEIVIAINTSTDDSPKLVRDFVDRLRGENPLGFPEVRIVESAISYEDPEFDGKIKAFALSHCKQPYAILLDCDEVLVPTQRKQWLELVRELEMNYSIDALFIPVVDLFYDEEHYKCGGGSLSAKWYLHRNLPNITRGVVKWAYREDGSIDTSKSDTCEAIYRDSGELVRAAPILAPLPHYIQVKQLESGDVPFVVHLGWLDKQKRIKQNTFWEPVWTNRNKSEVKTQKSLDELDKIPYYPCRLLSWKVEK